MAYSDAKLSAWYIFSLLLDMYFMMNSISDEQLKFMIGLV